jgi:hypothetical protein
MLNILKTIDEIISDRRGLPSSKPWGRHNIFFGFKLPSATIFQG